MNKLIKTLLIASLILLTGCSIFTPKYLEKGVSYCSSNGGIKSSIYQAFPSHHKVSPIVKVLCGNGETYIYTTKYKGDRCEEITSFTRCSTIDDGLF